MAGFNTAPTLIKVTFILVILGVILHIIGFFTPYWASWDYWSGRYRSAGNRGLWRWCNEDYQSRGTRYGGYERCGGYAYSASWFEAVQAFEVIGFIAAIVSLILIILYIFVPATAGKKIVFILTLLATFAAAGCILLGIIIYGSKMDHLSWSFVLCTIAGIIFAISGILLLVDMCKR